MRLTPMEINHLPSVARLCGQLGYDATETELAEQLGKLVADPDHHLLVSLDDTGVVAGWAHGRIDLSFLTGRRLEIAAMIVDESYRGRGMGADLLAALEDWGRESRCAYSRVASRTTRTRAHGFYQKLGYDLEKTSHLFQKPL